MATSYLDPSADGALNEWTKSSGTSAALLLDDGVRQPTAPPSGTDRITSSTDEADSDLVFPNTLTHVAGATYTLWVHSGSGAKRGLDVSISTDDSTFGNRLQLHGASQSEAWHSRDLTSLITSQAALDGLRVRLTCNATAGGGGAGQVAVNAVYVEQTTLDPAQAQVAWAELEVPFLDAQAQVAWTELEVPVAPAQAEVAFAELEVPLAPAQAEVAFAELEVPLPDAQAQVAWAELEVPLADAQTQVAWAELEVPAADARAEVAFAELEVPLAPAQAHISYAEVEIPDYTGGPGGAPPSPTTSQPL